MHLIRGDLGLYAFLKRLIGPSHGPGLVRSHVIEHCEKGLPRFSSGIPPVGILAGHIPGFLHQAGSGLRVIVRFDIVGAKIARLPEVKRKAVDCF